MNPLVSRRRFLQTAGATLLAGPAGNWAVNAARAADTGSWQFPLIGDLHYDRKEHHDFDWVREHQAKDMRQIEQYCAFTAERMPRLFASLRQGISTTEAPVPFAIHIGDFVEGLCGSEALARKQCQDAIEFVREAELGIPFLMTKGNHDVTGPGAREAYAAEIVPFLRSQAPSVEIPGAAFLHQESDWLFVFYDAYDDRSLGWFETLVNERRPRRVFFVIHPPVVPYNARATWHIYARPQQAEQRNRLLNLLGRTQAVVLSGHLHKFSLVERHTPEGSFVQLAVASVGHSDTPEPKGILSGLDAYGPDLVDLEPSHSPETVEERRRLLAEEKRFIRRFEYAETWGHADITVNGSGAVTAEIRHGAEGIPWKRFDLT